MTAATETWLRFQKKRRNLQKQVDAQSRTLMGYWREREELLARGDRWRAAFAIAAPFAFAALAAGLIQVLR